MIGRERRKSRLDQDILTEEEYSPIIEGQVWVPERVVLSPSRQLYSCFFHSRLWTVE